MIVFSQLQEFLSNLPAFQTQAERMALISQTGFENLHNQIDWSGSAKTFTSGFLNLLIQEGQQTLFHFLTQLNADNTLLGKDQQDRLSKLSQAIQALTPEQWKAIQPETSIQKQTAETVFPVWNVHRRLFQVRNLPKEYVPRPNAFNQIKRLLLSYEEYQKATAITTALRGAGGFGKTTLALALCHDPEIQAAFPDGILWVELGEHPSGSLAVLNELCHVLEPAERDAFTLEEAQERWRGALEKRSCLLVIDDVWQTEALEELLKGGPRCGRLITTRNDQLLPDDAKRVWVDAMEPVEAMALLCEGVIDKWQHIQDPSVLEEVVIRQLGCWPLLVSLARGMLKNQMRLGKTPRQALARLQHAYDARGMVIFHLGDRNERQRNVDVCLDVSLRQLEEWVPAHYQARQRYLELAVFPEDTDIALSTLQIYWKGTGGLHEDEVEELCLHLSDLSFLLPRNPEHPAIRMHDVLRHST